MPLLEKLFADGTLREYEVDTQAIHTEAPGLVFDYLPGSERGRPR